MLDSLRRGVRTWVAKALLGLLVLSFAVWGIGGEIFSFSFSTPVARVGDTKITAGQFARAVRHEQDRLSQSWGQPVTLTFLRELGIDRRILADLQRDAALAEELAVHGVRVPDEIAADAAVRRPEFQNPDGSFSREALRLYLRRQGLTEAEFIDLNRGFAGQNLLIGPALAEVRPPPGMAARIATHQGESRTVATVTLPLDTAADPGTPDEAALNDFYDQNPALYTEPERRSGDFLHIDFPALAESLQPEETEIAAAYEAGKETYTTEPARVIDQITMPDRVAAEDAVARIRAGEARFEDIAAEQGQDPAALSLGRVTREDVPSAMADAVFAATEPGVLDPIRLPAGIAIVRIAEVETGGQQPLEEVADEIAERLASDAAHTRAGEFVNRIEEMRAGGADLAEIAASIEIPLERFEGLAADASLPGGGRAEGVRASPGFIEDVFAALEGEERPIIDTPDGGFLVVLVDGIDPGGLSDFAQVADKIAADWANRQRLEELEARGAEMAAGLGEADATLEATAGALGLSTTAHEAFTRADTPSALQEAAVDLAFETPGGEGFSLALPDGGGVMVGEVLEIIPLDPLDADQATVRMTGIIEQAIRADAAEYFTRAIAAAYETGQNPEAIEEVFVSLGSGQAGGEY